MEENHRRVPKFQGDTDAEKYLGKLCNRTFLSLWSYSSIFRDQGVKNGGDGKEVCDLLVVFDKHVIIFSDKDCAFPKTDNLEQDWRRWFGKAVKNSAKQLWGAERWIREYPSRLFLDRKCQIPFPVSLPDPNEVIFHLILVGHNAAKRCSEELGGSGSFMFDSALVGLDNHTKPFMTGDLDPTKTYIHIFDDTALSILMRYQDTITDFVSYLKKKEKLVREKKIEFFSAGEEELLAYYSKRMNECEEHDFIFPEKSDRVAITEGIWQEFQNNPQRVRQIEADKISYFWDTLIENFSKHALDGTQYIVSDGGFKDSEKVLRFLASASRFKRRLLANSFLDFVCKTDPNKMSVRYVKPTQKGDPHYVFLLLPLESNLQEREYRKRRQEVLTLVVHGTKFRFPEAEDIIGIATESGRHLNAAGSEDAIYMDARSIGKEDVAEVEKIYKEVGFTDTVLVSDLNNKEYPEIPPNPRNKPCFCGSDKKYKKCHGN